MSEKLLKASDVKDLIDRAYSEGDGLAMKPEILEFMENEVAFLEKNESLDPLDSMLKSLESLGKEMTLNYSHWEYSFQIVKEWYTSYAETALDAVKKLKDVIIKW